MDGLASFAKATQGPSLPSLSNYDDLYRLTDTIYRDSSSKDYTSYGGSWASGNYSNYIYDDVSNRISATDADPFGNVTATSDSYTINDANEYTQVNRDSTNQNPSHDAAHNIRASVKKSRQRF